MSAYATDGRCHNSEPCWYGQECGKPAEWIGTQQDGFRAGFCAKCRAAGYEARGMVRWEPYPNSATESV